MKLSLLALFLAAPVLAADAPKAAPAAAPKAEVKAEAKPAPKAEKKDAFKNDDERRAYAVGYLMGRNVAPFEFTASEVAAAQRGLSEAAAAKPAAVEIRVIQPTINDMLARRMAETAANNKAKGKAYAEKWLKANPSAKEIPGGGWYVEVAQGSGALPSKVATIKADYRGTSIDGVEFDSSYSRGEPTQFALNGVIPCWTNGISMMKVGGKAKLLCPSDVAYGDQGRPGIKPGATLNFEVTLIEILSDDSAAPAKKK